MTRAVRTLAAAALLAPAAAAAQGWTVEAAAGRAVHDPVSARVSTVSASLALSYDGRGRWLYGTGGAPLEGGGPAWGAAGAGGWLGIRRDAVQLGVSASAHGFAYGAAGPNPAGGGGSVDVVPRAAWTRGAWTIEAGSGFAGAVDVTGDSSGVRTFSATDARVGTAMAGGWAASAEARLLVGEGDAWPYAGAAVEVERPWGGGWAYAGRWLADGHPAPADAYGVGVRVRAMAGTEVLAALRQEPLDPVYWSTPRRTWSLSLRRSFGGRRSASVAPVPDVDRGWAVFRLPRRNARDAPELIGDFSGWQPVAMTAEGDAWVARVRLEPGAYHYAFRMADGAVVVPDGLPAVDDGFGGRSAVLVVPGT